jgi:hypothetical protein
MRQEVDLSALSRVSVGILSWRRPSTLRHALRSYRRTGLLDAVGEVTLFCNEADPRELNLARDYRLRALTSDSNVGIGPAFARLAQVASRPLFLFLENDWPCTEPFGTAQQRLATAATLVETGAADAVRLRHRRRYGHPLYSRAALSGRETELRNLPHLLDAAHWHAAPEEIFAGRIARRQVAGEEWFFAPSDHAAYTNNPSLYRTDFARDVLAPRGLQPGLESEAALQDWWQGAGLTVAMGEGLFTHRDPGKEWRRAGRALRRLLGR